jgi:hypothetical protein
LSHTNKLGFKSRKTKVTIPWAKLCQDPASWISPDSAPDGFQWADPSKIRIGEVFRLFTHWIYRKKAGLEALEWVPSCPLLNDSEEPSRRGRSRRTDKHHSDQTDDETSSETSGKSTESSDEEADKGSSNNSHRSRQWSDHNQSGGPHASPGRQWSEDREWDGFDVRSPPPLADSHHMNRGMIKPLSVCTLLISMLADTQEQSPAGQYLIIWLRSLLTLMHCVLKTQTLV